MRRGREAGSKLFAIRPGFNVVATSTCDAKSYRRALHTLLPLHRMRVIQVPLSKIFAALGAAIVAADAPAGAAVKGQAITRRRAPSPPAPQPLPDAARVLQSDQLPVRWALAACMGAMRFKFLVCGLMVGPAGTLAAAAETASVNCIS